MSDTRYLGFDETMDMLGLSEDQLMDLVAANELRAFRIDRDMKFKESDIRARQGGAPAAAAAAPEAEEAVELEEADELTVDFVAQEPAEAAEPLELEELEEPVALMDSEEALPAEEAVPELAAQESPLELTEVDESELEVLSTEDETLATVEIPDSGLVEAGGVDLAAGDEAETQAVGDDSEVGDGTEVVLDSSSSDGLGTEEIVFEDEDLAIGDADEEELGTQEVTVREEALADEAPTIADQQITLDIDEDGDTVAPAGEDEEEADTSRPVSGRRSSAGSVRRRGWDQPKAAGQGDLAFAAVLAVTCLIMIMPIMLYATIAWKGYTLGRETFPVGDIKLGQPVEMAAVFKPDWTDLFRDKLVDVFGSPMVKKPALAPVTPAKPAEAETKAEAKAEEKPAENAK